MRRILGVLGAGIALWFALPTVPALACTCAVQTAESHFRAADVIFTGTVSAIADHGDARQVSLDVELVYKGPPSDGIEVRTPDTPDACGIQFGVDRSYLVFARATGDTYAAELCSGTTDDLTFLEREGFWGREVTVAVGSRDQDPDPAGNRIPYIAAAAGAVVAVFTVHARRFRAMDARARIRAGRSSR